MGDGSSYYEGAKERGSIRIVSLAAALVLSLVSACTRPSTDEARQDKLDGIGAGVTVDEPDLQSQLRASLVPDVSPPLRMMVEPASEVFNIGPSGPLPMPTTLTLPLLRPAPTDGEIVVFTAEAAEGPWSPVPTTVAPDGLHVTVQVSHLSFFTALRISTAEVLHALKTEIIDGLTGDFTAEAERPQCSGEDEARSDGYSITSTQSDTVYWCFGIENGVRVLRVVNNRRYPLLMEYPGLAVVSQDNDATWARFGEFIAGKSKITVLPRSQAVFAVDINPAQQGTVSTTVDALGQHVYAAFTGIEALVEILTRFGAGSGSEAINIAGDLLSAADCYQQLGDTAGEILNACLSPAQILDAFGLWGVVLAPIMATGEISNYFRSTLNAIGDQINDRDRYEINVDREGARQLPEICGIVHNNNTGTDARVAVRQGQVSCGEALSIVGRYYNSPPEPPQGSSAAVTIDGWMCVSTSGTVTRDTGAAGGCEMDGQRIDLTVSR